MELVVQEMTSPRRLAGPSLPRLARAFCASHCAWPPWFSQSIELVDWTQGYGMYLFAQ